MFKKSFKEKKLLGLAFSVSMAVHITLFLTTVLMGQTIMRKPMLQLTEIDIIEPLEVPEVQEIIALPPPKKSVFNMIKKVVPVKKRKPRIRRPQPGGAAKKTTAKKATTKKRVYTGAPLISKKSIGGSGQAGRQPMISRKAAGQRTGTGAPKWDSGPGNRVSSGRKLNLSKSLSLPEGYHQGVVDANIAAALKGKRGELSLHKNSNINAIVGNVTQRKRMGLAAGRGSGSGANLKGFRDAFAVFGQIKNRKIIHMKMPRYPAWAEEQGIEASVKIHVGVLAGGAVDESSIYVESTSGYPQLDKLALQAISYFYFAPLPKKKPQVMQSGSVRFVFRLKR
ncbi:energy transducer TonB [bacterium]|nr:energy transducer TonB [bacterium]